jgi:hypothetical protein
LSKLPVLIEEIGEVGKAMAEGEIEQLKTELIQVAAVQVAAVCVAWLESLK